MEKQQLWERKLLDLSLRNNLVSLRTTKNLIPLLVPDLGPLEDALYNGQEFSIAPKPEQIPGVYPTDLGFDKLHQVDEWKEQLQDNKKIYAAMNRGELERSIVSLYRTARSSMEENGAITLYLSFGLLKWFDPKSPDKPRFAPLVLIPMEMVRKSAQSGYVIRQRDDEIQVNITLLELLKQDFGILIQNLDPIPQDDNGMDLMKLFEVFREHIRDQKDWEILDSACLGIFSFSQFVMWNDLRNRSDQLGENKLVRSLMDGQLSWGAEPMELPAKVEPESLILPIPADASQLFAIQSALGGNSFVLHGPPGTGKSQTITGIIANALAQGKTVLFVAEKMAALSVVQKRMEKLGLGEFCLELNSNKSKKRDVLDQMMRATQVTSSHDPKTYQALAEQTGKLRQELDLYAKSLHQSRDSGFSFYQMIGEYEKEINAPDISLSEEYINTINPARYQEDLLQVEQLAAMTKALGDVSQDPLRRIQNPNYQLSMRESIPKAAKEYLYAIKDISPLYQELKQLLPVELPENQQKFEDFAEIIDAFGQWDAMPVSWANLDTASLYNIYETAEAATSLQTDKRLLSQKWKAQAFTSNAQNLLNQWREISAKGFIGKLFGQGKVVSEIQSLYGVELPKENIPAALEELILFQSKEQSLAENVEKYSSLLGELYQGKNTNWEQVFTLSQRARESLLAMGHVPNGNQLRAKLTGEYKNSVLSFVQKKEIFSQARQTLDALIHIQDVNSQDYLNSEADLAQALMDKTNYIKEWMQRSEKIAELQDRGILGAGKEMTALLPQEYVPGYKKTLFTKLITKTLQEDSALDRFSGAQFNQKIQQFKRLDEELSQLSKKEIFYRLAAQVPNFTKEASQSSELGILQRAMRSGGRGLSIRKLFEQIPNILPRICPCMLMSPISAAQYLDPSREPFDLVIFDEASQLPTSKAVGVLARGKESIVVGDPKQMPPTAFFTGENLDEENIETEDLESILEDCLALSMPQTHLLWHYRSRHESLIAFSNHQFYDSKLYTFPSANDQQKMVSFVPSNGVFDRGNTRTNEIEAKLVVKEILSRFQDPAQNKNSIGVVTFNMSQQSLIEDLLEVEYSKNPELDQWANTGEEPLFVKNLENVQGDERDVILFSIGFGPDSEGKIYMNFGPLNKDGGWRRLNVAITRSKKEMRVFSSLNPENIDLSKTQSQGVSALKGFLDYAKTGKLQGGMGVDAGDSQGIVKALQNYLEKAGFGSSAALGQSKFKIDLAVQDPQNPDQYLLGIMLDGPTYRDAKTTKDREVAPFGVLEGLGWRIHRIWSMDFWENPEKELDKLDKLLEAIQKGETVVENAVETVEETVKPVEAALPVEPSVESVEVATEPVKPVQAATTVEAVKPVEPVKPIDSDDSVIMPSTEQKKVDFKIQLQPYTAAKLPAKKQSPKTYVSEKNQGNITTNILAIIEAEAPISEQLLTKKLLKSFGISRSSIEVQAETIRLLNALALPTTIQNGIRYFWTKNQDPENYHLLRQNGSDEDKRDVDQIVKTELQNALILVLQEQIAIPRDALIKEASKKLGYPRISENIKLFLDDALGNLETQGYIQQKGDMLQLW